MQFNLIETAAGRSIACVVNGELYVADSSMRNFDKIVEAARADDTTIVDLFTPLVEVAKSFESVTERVTLNGGNLYFDGVLVADALAEQIIRFHDGGLDYLPLANFMEKVYLNPNEHSRDHLYRWMLAESLSITPGGDIVGYKGLNSNFTSVHQGYGIVNNIEHNNAHLDNSAGNVVTIPRDQVTFDPANGCSFGLHVGTHTYASGWGSVVMEVHVNPRDVVSVPSDCGSAKMRVCRYTVVQQVEAKYIEALVGYTYDDSDDTGDDYCFNCGEELDVWSGCEGCDQQEEDDAQQDRLDEEQREQDIYNAEQEQAEAERVQAQEDERLREKEEIDRVTAIQYPISDRPGCFTDLQIQPVGPARDIYGRFAPKA